MTPDPDKLHRQHQLALKHLRVEWHPKPRKAWKDLIYQITEARIAASLTDEGRPK